MSDEVRKKQKSASVIGALFCFYTIFLAKHTIFLAKHIIFLAKHTIFLAKHTIFLAISPAVVFDAFLFRKMEEERRNCYRVWKDQGKALQAIVCLHPLPRTSSPLSCRVCTRLPTSQAMYIALQAILRLHVFP